MTEERSRTMNSPELAKLLEIIPAELKHSDQELLCKQMTLVVVPDEMSRKDRDVIESHCQDIVQSMHDCMHNSPRVAGLLALNCLAMLDLLLRRSVPTERDRMELYISLIGLASKIGAMQSGGGSPSDRIH